MLAPRHDFPARKVAEIVGAPGLPIYEHEVVKAIAEERVWERIVKEIAWSVPADRIKEQIADWMDILVPPVMEELKALVQEVVRLVPQERVQWTEEQIVEEPIHKFRWTDRGRPCSASRRN